MAWMSAATFARLASSWLLASPLLADDLGQRGDLRVLHAGELGALDLLGILAPLGQHALLLGAVLAGRRRAVLLGLLPGVQRGGEVGLVGLGELLLGDALALHLLVDLDGPGGEVGVLGRPRAGHRAGGADGRSGRARVLGGERGDLLGLGLGGVGRRVGGALDVLLRVLLAALDEPADLVLDLRGLAGALEVVGLLEVLGRRGVDRLLDGGDEGLAVERARLLRAHLLDLRACGLAGDLVAGRNGGGLCGRGAGGGRLVGLGLATRGDGLALGGLEVRILVRLLAGSSSGGPGRGATRGPTRTSGGRGVARPGGSGAGGTRPGSTGRATSSGGVRRTARGSTSGAAAARSLGPGRRATRGTGRSVRRSGRTRGTRGPGRPGSTSGSGLRRSSGSATYGLLGALGRARARGTSRSRSGRPSGSAGRRAARSFHRAADRAPDPAGRGRSRARDRIHDRPERATRRGSAARGGLLSAAGRPGSSTTGGSARGLRRATNRASDPAGRGRSRARDRIHDRPERATRCGSTTRGGLLSTTGRPGGSTARSLLSTTGRPGRSAARSLLSAARRSGGGAPAAAPLAASAAPPTAPPTPPAASGAAP